MGLVLFVVGVFSYQVNPSSIVALCRWLKASRPVLLLVAVAAVFQLWLHVCYCCVHISEASLADQVSVTRLPTCWQPCAKDWSVRASKERTSVSRSTNPPLCEATPGDTLDLGLVHIHHDRRGPCGRMQRQQLCVEPWAGGDGGRCLCFSCRCSLSIWSPSHCHQRWPLV